MAILYPLRCRTGRTAPSPTGSRNLFECQLAASGAGFRFAVAYDAHREEIWVVENGPVGVNQRVAELAALVDRSRGLRRDMAWYPTWERELAEQPS